MIDQRVALASDLITIGGAKTADWATKTWQLHLSAAAPDHRN